MAESVIVDASAMLVLLVGSPLAEPVQHRLRSHELHFPADFDAEVLSALGRLHRAGVIRLRGIVSSGSSCLYVSTMQADTRRRLLFASGIAALVGAIMWAYKSVLILITDDQPDYWFELALIWFGVSILLLASVLSRQVSRSLLVIILGWVSAVAGSAASLAYWIDGDDEGLFGPAGFVLTLSTIIFLFMVGGEVHERRLLGKYAFGPRLLAWLYVAGLPAGGVLSGLFGERYLEVGLLAVVAGWVIVGLGALHVPIDSQDLAV